RVGKEHARLFATPSGVLLEDMGAFAGVTVNGERIAEQHGPLRPDDVIGIGPHKLWVTQIAATPALPRAAPEQDGAPRGQAPCSTDRPGQAPASSVGRAALAAPVPQAPFGQAGPVLGRHSMAERPAEHAVPDADARQREAEFEWRRRI